jgi:hypothetical protein
MSEADDVFIIGSPEALTQLRDGLDLFLKRLAHEPSAIGKVEHFINPDGSEFHVRIRVGSSQPDEMDWKVLRVKTVPADPENKVENSVLSS